MTATQVFLTFLRETCTIEEYFFFANVIGKDNGNKYFKKRPLFKNNFVEAYLSRNNRHLANFMTRLFVLAPNLINKRHRNPRWDWIVKRHTRTRTEERRWSNFMGKGVYFNYYRNKWYFWLCFRIDWDKTEKRKNSPFKKGETYDFKLKDKQLLFRNSLWER